MKRIKKGDTVIVIAGKNKGHIGAIKRVLEDKVVVEGANLIKKHMKPSEQYKQGGIISLESPLHVSNVALYNPITKKADKIGFKFVEEAGVGRKVRYFKSNNELVDLA